MRRRHRDSLGKSGYPSPKVCSHSIHQRSQVDRFLTRRSADTLESVRHTFKSFEIGLHVIQRRCSRRLRLRLAQQLDPAADAGERSTELVGRFAGHSGPDLFAIRAPARAKRIRTGEQNHSDEDRLQNRNEDQAANEGRVTKVHGSNPWLNDRNVLSVELRQVVAHFLRAQRSHEWDVRGVRRPTFRVGENHRHPGFPDVAREIEQRCIRRVRVGITETVVHARVHQTNA